MVSLSFFFNFDRWKSKDSEYAFSKSKNHNINKSLHGKTMTTLTDSNEPRSSTPPPHDPLNISESFGEKFCFVWTLFLLFFHEFKSLFGNGSKGFFVHVHVCWFRHFSNICPLQTFDFDSFLVCWDLTHISPLQILDFDSFLVCWVVCS